MASRPILHIWTVLINHCIFFTCTFFLEYLLYAISKVRISPILLVMTLRFREMTRFDQSPWLVHGWVVIDIPALCFYVKCAYSASQLSLLIAASNCFFLLSLVTSLFTYMSKVYSLPLHLLEASEIVLICSCQSSWLWSEV